ncbi:hypothetical protein [Sphingomonas sp. GM_Shp_2]|uniref:hypothetical protein n=1 Tax=Sphingomonas sp. GM_Shp_2 TaxID=2937380 RepID=UPI00226A35AA|nr:hypothetical protein [Sphingomonas sp. GM_Shp_2]
MGAFDAVAGIVTVKDGELRERLVEHRFTDCDTDGGQPARRDMGMGMGMGTEPPASGLLIFFLKYISETLLPCSGAILIQEILIQDAQSRRNP